jgi:hypothetical protein
VINKAQKCHGLEYISYHRKSQSITHGGRSKGKRDPNTYSEESAQSISGMDRENSKVQETELRNLNASYLGCLHNLSPKEGLAKTKRMTDHS